MSEDTIQSAIEMYAYHGQLGLERIDLQYCSVVRDLANPEVWSSNKAFAITATSAAEIAVLMREVDEVFAQLNYRHFAVDPLSPKPFEAHLALNDYSEYAAILQMVLPGKSQAPTVASAATIRPVSSEEDWQTLRQLVFVDHAEGARTHAELSHAVTEGIVAGYRAKAGPCQFFLAAVDEKVCAYGSGINAPNGMGMVEDLFTLSEFRGRGVASKVIAHCVEFCRERGAGDILIGSHTSEAPKHLYNKLGFEPAFVTRDLIKQR